MTSNRSSFPGRSSRSTALLAPTLLVVACLSIIGCASNTNVSRRSVTRAGPQGGHLVLIGGGKKPADVVELFVKLAVAHGPYLVVLPVASEDPEAAGADYVDLFSAHGARDVRVVHIRDRRDAHRQAYVDTIRGAGGVFFTGGDQKRIGAWLVDTPVMDAIRAMKNAGGVVGGTSAGTACQSAVMLTGDAGDESVVRAGNIPTAQGTGLFEGVIVDQHFLARRRHNRLITAILEHPGNIGVGIDEGTAVWVKPDSTFRVLGESSVFVYDPSSAEVSVDAAGRISVSGMRTDVLVAGQAYDLKGRRRLGRGGSAPGATGP